MKFYLKSTKIDDYINIGFHKRYDQFTGELSYLELDGIFIFLNVKKPFGKIEHYTQLVKPNAFNTIYDMVKKDLIEKAEID